MSFRPTTATLALDFAAATRLHRQKRDPGTVGGTEGPLPVPENGVSMHKRLVTRYATKSVAAADENQRRVEAVFEKLNTTQPANVSYIVLRLADNSFLHVSFHDHGDDEVNPISETSAFARFQEGHADRRKGDVDQQTATLVGAYITVIG